MSQGAFAAGMVDGSDRAAITRLLEDWLAHPALQILVTNFGGVWPAGSLTERLATLEEFSAAWDFRAGRERFEVAAEQFTAQRRRLIEQGAEQLGLSRVQSPSQRHYDYGLILGGTATSCLLRARLIARVMRQDQVQLGQIVALGSSRPVAPAERVVADSYAPSATTEYELLRAAVDQELGESAARVVDVPSSDPTRRTNTADQYEYVARELGVRQGSTVLLSTSQIYYPFHLFGALAGLALPTSAAVEVVSYPLNWAATMAITLRTPTNLLQELRSAIWAAYQLAKLLR